MDFVKKGVRKNVGTHAPWHVEVDEEKWHPATEAETTFLDKRLSQLLMPLFPLLTGRCTWKGST